MAPAQATTVPKGVPGEHAGQRLGSLLPLAAPQGPKAMFHSPPIHVGVDKVASIRPFCTTHLSSLILTLNTSVSSGSLMQLPIAIF